MLDQFLDQIHAPSTNSPFVEPWSFGHPSLRFTQKHPLFADVFLPSVNAGPANCWLPLILAHLGPLPSLSSLGYDGVHCQARDLVSDRIWIDCRFSHKRHYCSSFEEPATFMPPVFPFAYQTNLTSVSILRPSPYHASTPTFFRSMQHICKSQNSTQYQYLGRDCIDGPFAWRGYVGLPPSTKFP